MGGWLGTQVGAVSLEDRDIITASHTGWGDSAAEECSCLLPRCRRDPGKQPGPTVPTGGGGGMWCLHPPGSGQHRHSKTPGLRKGRVGGGQSWDPGTQLELTGWVPCRAMPCYASPAWQCQRDTGTLRLCHWGHPGRRNPKLMASPSSANTPWGSAPFRGAPHWSGLLRRVLACPALAVAGL